VIAVEQVPEDQVSSYGIIDPETHDGRVMKMRGMVEKPSRESAPSNMSITGRYILQPEIFDLLSSQAKGAGGEIQLTDAMDGLMKSQSFHAVEYEGGSFDCGNKAGYLRAFVRFALDHAEEGQNARDVVEQVLKDR
ncbi:MAG TPA: UTP--glucose-1-phosphate uridylyltransferase, partial [Alphaproteobacteria bacterium]|nr:UTP--glucose-1-phosphate uridylyltransferase [Alphaproteobacteria bacterium]